MKILRWLCLGLLLSSVPVWGWQKGGLYPTAIYGVYQKEKLPVFDVKGNVPESQYEGKRVKLPESTITIERSDYYNPGYIEVLELKTSGINSRVYSNENQINPLYESQSFMAHLTVRIKSREKLDNTYMAVVCVPDAAVEKHILSNERLTVSFKKLETVPAEVETEINMRFSYIPENYANGENYKIIPLFYSNGYEILNNSSSGLAYVYFRDKEEAYQKKLLEEYLENNKGKTMKHTPVVVFLPYLPPKVFEKEGGIDTAAVLTVDDTGTVRKVVFEDELKPDTVKYLERGLLDWLYLPPLKEGEPKPFRVKVPLKY